MSLFQFCDETIGLGFITKELVAMIPVVGQGRIHTGQTELRIFRNNLFGTFPFPVVPK